MSKQEIQKAPGAHSSVVSGLIPMLQPRAFSQPLDEIESAANSQPILQAKNNGALLGHSLKHSLGRMNLRSPSHSPIQPPIQPKLTIGQVNDPYEQEADQMAAQVVARWHAPPVQRSSAPEEEEELQMKPLANSIQRVEEEDEELQMKPVTASIQRVEEEEEELQMKPLGTSIQRVEEEEEELQMKPLIQRKSDLGGTEASTDLEASISRSRGGGQRLSDSIRQPIEQAFGADFSGVKIHTDAQSDTLNRSLQSRAFTTGNDVFFKQGEYNPQSRSGQELIAHELTHVVQQNSSVVQRSTTQSKIATLDQQEQQAGTIQRKVGTIKKSAIRKSDTVHWYDWNPEKGLERSDRTIEKGANLVEARPTIYDDFAWVSTGDQQGYLRKSNLSVVTWGETKNPKYDDRNYFDKRGNRLLEETGDSSSSANYKETTREWYINQAILMEAYRSLEGQDTETQKRLAHAILQSFSKSAPVNQALIGDPLGVQSTPFFHAGGYHRSDSENNLLNKLESLVSKEMGIKDAKQIKVLSDPLFLEVLAREFPVFQEGQVFEKPVNTDIDTIDTFTQSVNDLIANVRSGYEPKNTFVFNATKFYNQKECTPSEIDTCIKQPLEGVLIGLISAQKNDDEMLQQTTIEAILNFVQIVILTKVKGVDVLIVPKLFQPLSPEEKESFIEAKMEDEMNLYEGVDRASRDIFMTSGSHDDRKLSSAMIESGARMEPIKAKEAILDFVPIETLFNENSIKKPVLANSDIKTPTVCKNIQAFLATKNFINFCQLSEEKDAPPYQKIYPAATASLLTGLAETNPDKENSVDKVFEDKQIKDVLQFAYYRMMNAMAGAATYKHDLIQFMNNIELIHDQIQMILAITTPHQPETTFGQSIATYMKNAPEDKLPTIPDGLDPKIHHKASAMHSVASVLSSAEAEKEQQQGTRSLNALVLKDNYYEASGAVGNSKTYDVSVLDGYKLGNNELSDSAYENGKKPKGAIDIYICDFHHNISVERSEYRLEDITHQVDELFDKGWVADKFTVAIDCTVDFIRSDDVRKFLEHNKNRITGGDLNVVLYRSAQKFDMLGMDNYYGGYTVTINNGESYKSFNKRINQAEDQVSGLSHQGLAHLAKFGAEHQDAYREAIMSNTKKLYDSLSQCQKPTSPLYIAMTNDPRNVFLDIQFPGRSEDFAMGTFYLHFTKWAQAQGLAFTTRPSFGFATTNFTTIAGSKVRLNPGLESEDAIQKYVRYFNQLQALLDGTDKGASDALGKCKSEQERGKYLDTIGKKALANWSAVEPKSKSVKKNKSNAKSQLRLEPSVSAKLPAASELVCDAGLSANPTLYFQINDRGDFNFKVTSTPPGAAWTKIEQFCSYLAVHWLTNGHGADGLRFDGLDEGMQQAAVDTLREWGSSGGLQAQKNHAITAIEGNSTSKDQVITQVHDGSYPHGTRIWFGDDRHAEAAVVLDTGDYRVYDPNTGSTQTMDKTQFEQYIQSKNAFVVS
jgi:Domain of unknown function (DUF4157)